MAGTVRRLDAGSKLEALRRLLRQFDLHAYVVPSSDAHNSEYVAAHDSRRAFISGFTGSAGTAVVTATEARLWTDGRYFTQAGKELDASVGWQLMKDRLKETPSVEEWLGKALTVGQTVGVNPFLFPINTIKKMKAALSKRGITLSASPSRPDLVDMIWQQHGQPPPPAAPVMVHPLKHAGTPHEEKLASVRKELASEGVAALVVSALDQVAWLFNIRGGDVECNPVVMAYAIITATEAVLCVDAQKLSAPVREHLGPGVRIAPYDAMLEEVRRVSGRVWMDPASCNYGIYEAAAAAGEGGDDARVLMKASPLALMKALKQDAEIEGMRQAHVRDAAALVTFFSWLEVAVTTGRDARTGEALARPLTEFTAGEVLDGMRAEQAEFVSLSFPTIAGMGPNGAIIHYRAQAETAAAITAAGTFLCDSGGQYRDGTTDVTRTLHFGMPTEREVQAYTRVLQGHIAMSSLVFPTGTSGVAIDAFARCALWRVGLDYRHGTGHGVGAFLNVHEGPQGVSSMHNASYEGGLQARMTITDEPGYYEEGAFGIRIENVLITKEASTPNTFGGKPFLCFEPLTLVPIATNLVEASLLSDREAAWLNDYNARVRTTLTPLLSGHALAYLLRQTEPLASK